MSKAPKITSLQSLQYLRENVNDEVDFLPADELQRFLQTDASILGVSCQTCPNYPKYRVGNMYLRQYLKKIS